MKYPKFLKNGDVIAVAAPSLGIFEEDDIENFGFAKEFLEERGYHVQAVPSLFKLDRLWASASPEKRAEELMSVYDDKAESDKTASLVFAASGGETELLILPYLDGERLRKASPKWFSGYSDNTVFGYYLLTSCDTASIYGYNVGVFGCEPPEKTALMLLDLLEGKALSFNSLEGYRNLRFDQIPEATGRRSIVCDTPSIWKTNGNMPVSVKGRAIGGCLDLFPSIIGTRYDKTKEFIERYGDDGILWFLESCDLNPAGVVRALWQMREAGWFDKTVGFVFGRPHIGEEFFGCGFIEAVTELLGCSVPMIFDADFGHKSPVLPIVNGSIMTAEVKDGRGRFTFELK